MNSETLLQTYVRYGDSWFFVSTTNRESSSPALYGYVYAETIAWEWDPNTGVRGKMLGQDGCNKNSIMTHQKIVEKLYKMGKITDET